MNTTVWKYQLELKDGWQTIQMPAGAIIIEVGQQVVPTLWAIVDPKAPLQIRNFHVVGTGHQIPDRAEYIGTSHCPPFVWHIFILT